MSAARKTYVTAKVSALRAQADEAHPNSTRGIIDALCTVAELLLIVTEQLDDLHTLAKKRR